MKYNIILILCLACGLVSCYDDEGNYDYHEIDELTISGIPEEAIAALHKAENLVLSPVVTSKYEGEIAADNPNYEFSYYYNRSTGSNFLTPSLLDSSKVKDLNILAEIDPGSYTGWFRVKDLRTNIVTSAEFKMSVVTSTSLGWLVLCEEGVDRRVRVDMIGEIGDRIVLSRDLLSFLPESHGAYQMVYESKIGYAAAPFLNLYAEDASFLIYSNNGAFSSTDYSDATSTMFVRKTEDVIVKEDMCYTDVIVTKEGDVYQRANENALYDVKINVDVPLTEPTYKMAPFVGTLCTTYGYNGVLYDKTNKAFKYFLSYAYNQDIKLKYLFDPADPAADEKYFDWKTGKDMVYMEGTRQGRGVTFALMKDALGQYSIYGITTGQYMATPTQFSYIEIEAGTAPGLESATCFAFCPNLPFLFYNNGSEVYLYDMATRKATSVLSLPGETISMLKFNQLPSNGRSYPQLALDCQYRLAVGSAKTGAEAGNEGVLRFYDVPEFAAELTQFGDTYSGFGVIKDIAYKAR
ncbi:MAG: hypothetical protein K2I90_13460 [Odoribacter sp.]|nr:hypothetical protein [Odoribacter sp.]